MRDRALAAGALLVLVALAALWLSRRGPDVTTPPTRDVDGTTAPRDADAQVPARDVEVPVDVATPATAPSSPAPIAVRDAPVDRGARVVLRGPWGQGPGQFGRSGGEGNPEAPMSLAVSPDGDLVVLDQVNLRTQRFRDGRFSGAWPLPGAAAQDLALLRDGRSVTLDRLGDPSVTVYDAAGRVASRIPLVGRGVTEGGAVTGLFADRDGVYVEREHREVVRVADADGRPVDERATLWGRPSRDGVTMLRAALVDRATGAVSVTAASRANGAMDWSRTVRLDGMVLHLVLLDGDRRGRAYLGAAVATQRGDVLSNLHIALVRFSPTGEPDATLRLPMPPGAEEVFRQIVVDDEGRVFAMSPGPAGLEVVAYTFPD